MQAIRATFLLRGPLQSVTLPRYMPTLQHPQSRRLQQILTTDHRQSIRMLAREATTAALHPRPTRSMHIPPSPLPTTAATQGTRVAPTMPPVFTSPMTSPTSESSHLSRRLLRASRTTASTQSRRMALGRKSIQAQAASCTKRGKPTRTGGRPVKPPLRAA